MGNQNFTYNAEKKQLTFFNNGNPIGGMIGGIAEKKYKKIMLGKPKRIFKKKLKKNTKLVTV